MCIAVGFTGKLVACDENTIWDVEGVGLQGSGSRRQTEMAIAKDEFLIGQFDVGIVDGDLVARPEER
jgi:hypothetical protein